MEKTVLGEMNRLRRMTVAELQAEWLRRNGEPTRSRNRDYMFRRLHQSAGLSALTGTGGSDENQMQ